MLDILSSSLKYVIYWPQKEEVLRNIPVCFNEYLDVRAVVDCIEIFIQTPKKKCCQSISFSTYKGANTIKFMTAVSPGGLITFVSSAHMERTSDKVVFEKK